MEKEEAVSKGFTHEVYWNGYFWDYQCPRCGNFPAEGHTDKCPRRRRDCVDCGNYKGRSMNKLLIWISLFTLVALSCGMQTNSELTRVYKRTQTTAQVNTMTVTGSLNIRAMAGEEYDWLGTLSAGDTVTCWGYTVAKDGGVWCRHELGWSNVKWMVDND